MIKNIVTDLGNCWLLFDFERLIANIESKSPLSAKEITKILEWSDSWSRYAKGNIGAKDFFKIMIRQKLRFFDSFDAFEYFWCNGVFSLNQKYLDTLIELKEEGYGIYCLSNIDELHWRYVVENFPKETFLIFKKCFLSFEMSSIKPEVEIYNKVITEIGGAPDEFLFIDDLIENVEGAANGAGMKILLYEYKNHSDCVKRLKKYCE